MITQKLKRMPSKKAKAILRYVLFPLAFSADFLSGMFKYLYFKHKKVLAGILATAMLCTILPIASFSASAAPTQWDGSVATGFSGGGTGTSTDPYKIATAAELKLYACISNGLNLPSGFSKNTQACAKLTEDIYLNIGDVSGCNGVMQDGWQAWFPIGYNEWDTDGDGRNNKASFIGTFNGNNHIISGLYFNTPDQINVGLFGYVLAGCNISNIKIENSYINGNSYLGGVCGYAYHTTIKNCSFNGTITGTKNNIGGICGYANQDASIDGCYATGSVSTEANYIGGICGNSTFSISNSSSSVTVSGQSYTGGICGSINSTGSIVNCSNSGLIISSVMYSGGVCGDNNGGKISYCYNTGELNSPTASYIGGVCGTMSSGTLTNCYNTGNINAKSCVGGVSGTNYDSAITNCYNSGALSGNQNIKGFVYSLSNSTAANCYYVDKSETNKITGATFKTPLQFADGTVAYLLNGSRTEGTEEDPLIWYQSVDNGITPYDASPKFTGATVYYIDGKYTNRIHCIDSVSDSATIDKTAGYIYTNISKLSTLTGIVAPYGAYEISVTPSFSGTNDSFCGTGSAVAVSSSNKIFEIYTLVVMGDLNGDGVCDVFDCMLSECALSNSLTLSGASLSAADYDDDKEINSQDFQQQINRALSNQ